MPVSNLEELLEKGSLWYPDGGHSKSAIHVTSSFSSVSIGLQEVDFALASNGLVRGAVHEFYYEGSFRVPFSIVTMLAVQSADPVEKKYTLWIGKSCWPNPAFIKNFLSAAKARTFFSHSLFIDPTDEKKFLWSVEAALRSPAVVSVVASFKSMSLPLSRRLSLSAKSGQTLGLFAVHPAALHVPSAAATRWQIRPVLSPSVHPRFELSLLKQKGGAAPAIPWVCELIDDGEKISFNIPADVVGKSGAAKRGKIRKRA